MHISFKWRNKWSYVKFGGKCSWFYLFSFPLRSSLSNLQVRRQTFSLGQQRHKCCSLKAPIANASTTVTLQSAYGCGFINLISDIYSWYILCWNNPKGPLNANVSGCPWLIKKNIYTTKYLKTTPVLSIFF